MNRFLVNMAVVKVNWDRSGTGVLDNYIPLVMYTLSQTQEETLSLDDFRSKFLSIAEFNMPTGAIVSLLKRAEKRYLVLSKEGHGIYRINKEKISDYSYENTRDTEQRKYNSLIDKFIQYCKQNHETKINKSNVNKYFFEILYDIAPKLLKSISLPQSNVSIEKNKDKYLISKFVSHCNKVDNDSFEAIVSFVRGAMLTETFYYSSPSDISGKMRKVSVFFDTQFLLRALGLVHLSLKLPCDELIDMLKGMSVKMRCFEHTFNEIHGILYAASANLKKFGRLIPQKPGDVFDYINKQGWKSSDIELLLAKLKDKLTQLGVTVVEKPKLSEKYSIDEVALSSTLGDKFQNQSESARNHDIDCLTSIFCLRFGKPQEYLESCKAIFITTNPYLAKISTKFFNEQHDVSNAPVCMADQVFTSLIWLKAVKKTPNLPKDRLVANCYAALSPSDALWRKYMSEVESLKTSGDIGEEDYAVLIHSLEARDKLMELTFGEDDNVFGTVPQILDNAKKYYIDNLNSELKDQKSVFKNQLTHLETLITNISKTSYTAILWLSIILWASVIIFGLTISLPEKFDISFFKSINSLPFIIVTILTIFNLIFGTKVITLCKKIASRFERFIERQFRKLLVQK